MVWFNRFVVRHDIDAVPWQRKVDPCSIGYDKSGIRTMCPICVCTTHTRVGYPTRIIRIGCIGTRRTTVRYHVARHGVHVLMYRGMHGACAVRGCFVLAYGRRALHPIGIHRCHPWIIITRMYATAPDTYSRRGCSTAIVVAPRGNKHSH